MLRKSVPKARLLLTKPAHQADSLLDALAGHNISATNLPTIDILPPSDPAPLDTAINHITHYHCCIINSANAISPRLANGLKKSTSLIAAIGPATAKALSDQGICVDLIASPPSSEGLLSAPQLNPTIIAQQRIAIFCGENPKSLLKETLQQRQAIVNEIFCYRRQCAAPSDDAIAAIIEQPISHLVCASRDSLQNLCHILSEKHSAWMLGKALIVINDDMRRMAEEQGWQAQQITVAANATNSAIIKALQPPH